MSKPKKARFDIGITVQGAVTQEFHDALRRAIVRHCAKHGAALTAFSGPPHAAQLERMTDATRTLLKVLLECGKPLPIAQIATLRGWPGTEAYVRVCMQRLRRRGLVACTRMEGMQDQRKRLWYVTEAGRSAVS